MKPGWIKERIEALAPADRTEAKALTRALVFYEETLRNEDDAETLAYVAAVTKILDRAGVLR